MLTTWRLRPAPSYCSAACRAINTVPFRLTSTNELPSLFVTSYWSTADRDPDARAVHQYVDPVEFIDCGESTAAAQLSSSVTSTAVSRTPLPPAVVDLVGHAFLRFRQRSNRRLATRAPSSDKQPRTRLTDTVSPSGYQCATLLSNRPNPVTSVDSRRICDFA